MLLCFSAYVLSIAYNALSIVVVAIRAYSMWKFWLMTLRTNRKPGCRHLHIDWFSLISPGFGCFPLWNCHGLHLLVKSLVTNCIFAYFFVNCYSIYVEIHYVNLSKYFLFWEAQRFLVSPVKPLHFTDSRAGGSAKYKDKTVAAEQFSLTLSLPVRRFRAQ